MSISFYVSNEAGDWVFTRDELNPGDWVMNPETGWEEEVPNPSYRADLDINVATRNARIILDALGYELDDEGFWSDSITTFLSRGQAYLRSRLGKQSKGFDDVISEGPGPRMIDCGLPNGYAEKQIHRLVVMAQEGQSRGAVTIYAA